MKKFIATLLASFACMQTMQAIPSNLGESLLEYAAIENSPLLQDAIPQNEFIVDIKRKTCSFDSGSVVYLIRTATPQEVEEVNTPVEADIVKKCGHRKRCKWESKLYRAELTLTPNPELGPPLITVDSITLIAQFKRVHRS